MPKRAAPITKADLTRAIRAAKEEGAVAVEVRPDGTVRVQLKACAEEQQNEAVEDDKEIVL